MTHDEILNATRKRIAEIDTLAGALAEERTRLQAMLDANDKKIGANIIGEALKRLMGSPVPGPLVVPTPYPIYPYEPPPPPWGTIIVTTTGSTLMIRPGTGTVATETIVGPPPLRLSVDGWTAPTSSGAVTLS